MLHKGYTDRYLCDRSILWWHTAYELAFAVLPKHSNSKFSLQFDLPKQIQSSQCR